MFRALPRIIATAASAFAEQAGRLPEAVNDLDLVTLLATTIQMVLLLLPSIGITYLFIRLSIRFLRAVWNWSQPTWPRRAAGALATLGAVALFAYLWVPQLGLPGPRPAGDGGRVLAFPPPRFEPIRQEERLTVFDAVRNQVVPRPDAGQPRQGGEDTPASATPATGTTPQPATTAAPRLRLPAEAAAPVARQRRDRLRRRPLRRRAHPLPSQRPSRRPARRRFALP
jgi:hypothetical protein